MRSLWPRRCAAHPYLLSVGLQVFVTVQTHQHGDVGGDGGFVSGFTFTL
jgi:hypothetical protein